MVKLKQVAQIYEAQIIVQYLDSLGIKAQFHEEAVSLYPSLSSSMGIDIFVNENDFEKANKALSKKEYQLLKSDPEK